MIGLGLGFGLSDHSSELQKLRIELSHARSELSKLQRKKVLPPVALAPSSQRNMTISAGATDDHKRSNENITEEDWVITREMLEREKQGEYLLEHERPVNEKAMLLRIKGLAVQVSSKNALRLSKMFSKLGLSPEMSKQLKLHQEKIIYASLLAEQAISQLQKARLDYDNRIRSLLSDENYNNYRAFEDSMLARQQYDSVSRFAQRQGIMMNHDYEEVITALIQQSMAYTQPNYLSPYGEVYQSYKGPEKSLARAHQEVANITQAINQIPSIASQLDLPKEYTELLTFYYADYIVSLQKGISKFTPEDIKAMNEQSMLKYKEIDELLNKQSPSLP